MRKIISNILNILALIFVAVFVCYMVNKKPSYDPSASYFEEVNRIKSEMYEEIGIRENDPIAWDRVSSDVFYVASGMGVSTDATWVTGRIHAKQK